MLKLVLILKNNNVSGVINSRLSHVLSYELFCRLNALCLHLYLSAMLLLNLIDPLKPNFICISGGSNCHFGKGIFFSSTFMVASQCHC